MFFSCTTTSSQYSSHQPPLHQLNGLVCICKHFMFKLLIFRRRWHNDNPGKAVCWWVECCGRAKTTVEFVEILIKLYHPPSLLRISSNPIAACPFPVNRARCSAKNKRTPKDRIRKSKRTPLLIIIFFSRIRRIRSRTRYLQIRIILNIRYLFKVFFNNNFQ